MPSHILVRTIDASALIGGQWKNPPEEDESVCQHSMVDCEEEDFVLDAALLLGHVSCLHLTDQGSVIWNVEKDNSVTGTKTVVTENLPFVCRSNKKKHIC